MDKYTRNFRDLGGLKTTCGRKVRPGRLLRAALPAGLSSEETAALRGLGLKHIVDFRTLAEVSAAPVDEIGGVAYTHIDIMGENAARSADPAYWMDYFLSDPAGVEEAFTNTYREFVTSPTSSAGYAAFLRACADAPDGAILFHCTAGKDRTGFGAAIILKILGVPDDEILDDYLQTQQFLDHVSDYYAVRARKRGIPEDTIAEMGKEFGQTKPLYLKAALQAAADTYGSFEKYVSNGLGITDEEINILKQLYLE